MVLKYHVVLLCYFALKKVRGSGERSESCKRASQSLRPAQPSTSFFLSCCSQPQSLQQETPVVWLWHQGVEDTGKVGWVNERFPLARETVCMGQSVQHWQVPGTRAHSSMALWICAGRSSRTGSLEPNAIEVIFGTKEMQKRGVVSCGGQEGPQCSPTSDHGDAFRGTVEVSGSAAAPRGLVGPVRGWVQCCD